MPCSSGLFLLAYQEILPRLFVAILKRQAKNRQLEGGRKRQKKAWL